MRKLLKFTSVTSAAFIMVAFVFASLEPALVVAATDNDTVNVTLQVNEEISIADGLSGTGTVAMSPALSSTNNTANGSNTWTVTTNGSSGYDLELLASTDAALQHDLTTDEFEDFHEASSAGTFPADWSTQDNNTYAFGFSVYGTDTDGDFQDGSVSDCGTSGDPNVNLNYHGFDETTARTVASRSSTTSTGGIDTTVCYQVEQKGLFAPSGSYAATITATATTN
jgi:hypothetical protein